MPTTAAVSITARIARAAIMLVAVARAVDAQAGPEQKSRFEFLMSSGTLVPTGAQRNVVERGNFSAAQLSFVVHPNVALTTTLGWARSRDVATAGDPSLTYARMTLARRSAEIAGPLATR